MNELRISDTSRPAGSRDAHDPERPEVPLFRPPVAKGEGPRPKHRLGRHFDQFAALPEIAFDFLEQTLASPTSRVTFSRSHGINLFFVKFCVCFRRPAARLTIRVSGRP